MHKGPHLAFKQTKTNKGLDLPIDFEQPIPKRREIMKDLERVLANISKLSANNDN